MSVENYCQYSENIALSGLPAEGDFKQIKKDGYEIVLSLYA